MALKSTTTRYGAVAIAIHWITALAILGMLVSGLVATNTVEDAAKTGILRIHTITGSAILALTLFRIVWWWLLDRKPADVVGMPKVQARASHWLHWTLYGVILVMASSGLATMVLSGANLIIFGGAAGALPDFEGLVPRTVHGLLSRVLIALLAGHIGAALYHQFISKDHLLARMGLGH
jgi:cytochrome b561